MSECYYAGFWLLWPHAQGCLYDSGNDCWLLPTSFIFFWETQRFHWFLPRSHLWIYNTFEHPDLLTYLVSCSVQCLSIKTTNWSQQMSFPGRWEQLHIYILGEEWQILWFWNAPYVWGLKVKQICSSLTTYTTQPNALEICTVLSFLLQHSTHTYAYTHTDSSRPMTMLFCVSGHCMFQTQIHKLILWIWVLCCYFCLA